MWDVGCACVCADRFKTWTAALRHKLGAYSMLGDGSGYGSGGYGGGYSNSNSSSSGGGGGSGGAPKIIDCPDSMNDDFGFDEEAGGESELVPDDFASKFPAKARTFAPLPSVAVGKEVKVLDWC